MGSPHLDAFLPTTKKVNDKITPASFKRGLIVALHPQSWTADVSIIGNTQTVLKNVPLSSAINPNEIQAGDKCRIDMFDETNQNDMVVAYTYGRRPKPLTNSGFITITFTSTGGVDTSQKIAHGLGSAPSMAGVSTYSYGVLAHVPADTGNFFSTYISAVDSTYLYLTTYLDFAANGTLRALPIYWFASLA